MKYGWLLSDMTSHWQTDQFNNFCYGKMTGSDLINTNGISIYAHGSVVSIAYRDQDGVETEPRIWCTADEFVIFE